MGIYTALALRNSARVTMHTALIGFLSCCLMWGWRASAQTAPANQEAANQTIQMLEQRLAAQRRLLNDWGGLIHYGSENTELRPPAPGENRVVFLGDQITEIWGRGEEKFFPGKPYLNRGIAGQTTPQMLVRFHQD